MTAALTEPDPILPEIPDPETVRARLAIALTEADLLRAQLRVSTRLQRERERLRCQLGQPVHPAAREESQRHE